MKFGTLYFPSQKSFNVSYIVSWNLSNLVNNLSAILGIWFNSIQQLLLSTMSLVLSKALNNPGLECCMEISTQNLQVNFLSEIF